MGRSGTLTQFTGRAELTFTLPDLTDRRLLVTGSSGFLGEIVSAVAKDLGAVVIPSDLDMGVPLTSRFFRRWVRLARADCALHLAAHKYAVMGEQEPYEVAMLNIAGTQLICDAMAGRGPLVLASTCKAADPATSYGASKLIAERIVLNAAQRVVRLVNVLDSSGSVLRIWEQIPAEDPIPVVEARRMWLTPAEAVAALLSGLTLPPGRYGPAVSPPEAVEELARRAYPERELAPVPLRLGDRPVERLTAEGEELESCEAEGLVRIVNQWET